MFLSSSMIFFSSILFLKLNRKNVSLSKYLAVPFCISLFSFSAHRMFVCVCVSQFTRALERNVVFLKEDTNIYTKCFLSAQGSKNGEDKRKTSPYFSRKTTRDGKARF